MRKLNSFGAPLQLVLGGLLLVAASCGVLATFIWMDTDKRWDAHLARAESVGMQIYWSQQNDMPPPAGITIRNVSLEDAKLARAGKFLLMSSVGSSDFVTQLSLSDATPLGERSQINLAVTSPDLRYPVGRIASVDQATRLSLAKKLGQLSVLIASYCSDVTVYMKLDSKNWVSVRADSIWSCEAAPADYRLFGAGFLAIAMMALFASAKSVSGKFSEFASQLLKGTATDVLQPYTETGPTELRSLIRGINHFISTKSGSLERRARFLAGVSHDLGTAATRLRLRINVVKDMELKQKIDSDIETMTGMIESVLHYTQSEINIESKRRVSLVSIIETIVSDFQDNDQPVILSSYVQPKVNPQTLLFSKQISRRQPTKATNLQGDHQNSSQIVVVAQPLAITRAVTNLVDNALKYGRRATLTLEADHSTAKIHVDDFGMQSDGEGMEKLVEPFQRGKNSQHVKGFGIGLAVASTVAEQHGGDIQFARRSDGLRVTLSIQRNN